MLGDWMGGFSSAGMRGFGGRSEGMRCPLTSGCVELEIPSPWYLRPYSCMSAGILGGSDISTTGVLGTERPG